MVLLPPPIACLGNAVKRSNGCATDRFRVPREIAPEFAGGGDSRAPGSPADVVRLTARVRNPIRSAPAPPAPKLASRREHERNTRTQPDNTSRIGKRVGPPWVGRHP